MAVLTAEAAGAAAFGWGRQSIDHALAMFGVVSAVTLALLCRREPRMVRECCCTLGAGAMVLALLGVAITYDLLPCISGLGRWVTFHPAATVYSAFCGAMPPIIDRYMIKTGGKRAPEETK